MKNQTISRRNFFKIAGFGAVGSLVLLTGCPVGAAVLVRVAPTLVRVGSVLFRVGDGILTIQGILELGSKILDQQVSSSDSYDLKNGANLIIEDGVGKQFISAFGMYDEIGIVQECNPSGVMVLRSNPSSNAQVIRRLSVDERLGVFDLRHQGGWYHVKTLSGETGWIHGNCLQRLPRKNV